ncbi:TCP11 family protein [Abortiporus biennis]
MSYDKIRLKLEEKLSLFPDNLTLKSTISHLSRIQTGINHVSTGVLKHDFHALITQGIWENTPENAELLDNLLSEIAFQDPSNSTHAQDTNGFAPISVPAPFSAPLLSSNSNTATVLPTELIDLLNQAYFLHILATDPHKVLPPGKSLVSMMLRPNVESHPDNSVLKERVEGLLFKAFWDEAFESLSNPIPSVEMPRLKRLYEDMHVALSPLLPAGHPVLVTLSSPLSPTSSPLRSAISHLREILQSLKERCAPVRDGHIDLLLHRLEDPPTLEVAKVVVETVKDIMKLAEDMKEDLSQFVLGSMSERQLHGIISSQAKEKEREIVHGLWREETIKELWHKWINDFDPSKLSLQSTFQTSPHKWVSRLIQSLGDNIAVSSPLPTRTVDTHNLSSSMTEENGTSIPTNVLPPPLYFLSPTLLYIQNFLQAFIIAASLRSLVPVRPPSTPVSHVPEHNFMSRIWTLLKAEVNGEPESEGTKLINLADEIVNARRTLGNGGSLLGTEDESKLRAAVDRILRPGDPVFLLLQKRLLHSLADRLLSTHDDDQRKSFTPVSLQSGRDLRKHHKPTMKLDGIVPEETQGPLPWERKEKALVVKGFEDPVLVDAITEVLGKLRTCVEWTESTWSDVVGVET